MGNCSSQDVERDFAAKQRQRAETTGMPGAGQEQPLSSQGPPVTAYGVPAHSTASAAYAMPGVQPYTSGPPSDPIETTRSPGQPSTWGAASPIPGDHQQWSLPMPSLPPKSASSTNPPFSPPAGPDSRLLETVNGDGAISKKSGEVLIVSYDVGTTACKSLISGCIGLKYQLAAPTCTDRRMGK